jgi:hypothetical protein
MPLWATCRRLSQCSLDSLRNSLRRDGEESIFDFCSRRQHVAIGLSDGCPAVSVGGKAEYFLWQTSGSCMVAAIG